MMKLYQRLFVVGGAELFDDKTSMLCRSWEAWSW